MATTNTDRTPTPSAKLRTRPTTARPELAAIALRHLDVESLETRGRDALDFHEVSVAGLRAALEAAYAAGAASR